MKANDKIIAQLFQEYEKKRFDFYKDFRVKGFLAWQIIKRPLYYDITSDVFHQDPKKKKGFTQIKYLKALLKFPFRLFSIKTKKKELKALIVAHEIYKFEKDEHGKEINNFADHWYYLWAKDERIFFEQRSNIKDPKMSKVHEDLDINFVNAIVRVIVIVANILKWRNKTIEHLSRDLQSFLASDITAVPNLEPIIRKLILRFQIEFRFYSFLFGQLRPQFLIVTDEIGGARMAAANKAGIVVIENQHGHFDTLKPDYMMDSKTLGSLREALILPNYITVFGEYFKKSLINNSIWKNEEVIPVGNIRIDKYREKRTREGQHAFTILVPTQWNVFLETVALLNELRENYSATNVKILVKVHPREPKNHVEQYYKLAKEDSMFSVSDNQSNIYELFIKSDLVIGFDSTSLFEAVACGLPTVTIKTAVSTFGIHTYITKDEVLMNAIKISDSKCIGQLISNWLDNIEFRLGWMKSIKEAGKYLYSENCVENCRLLITKNS